MIGSQAVAGWIAELAFWTFLALGVLFDELKPKWAAVFVTFWFAGYFGLPRTGMIGGLFVTPYVAVLDIVLAFVVFKGDVRLT